jgi:predicted ATP-grasp superfamily ATP-dependent carboligase/protein-tyrosine-phosphatase
MMSGKVLVLGGTDRASLAVVRSLGRHEVEVQLGWHHKNSIVPHSRYVKKTHIIAPFKENDNGWQESLTEVLAKEKFELIIPTNDSTMIPLIRARKSIEPLCKLAIPTDSAFQYAFDKNKTGALARQLGIPVPHQFLVSTLTDIERIDLRYPIVIKPVCSEIVKNDSFVRLHVSYAYTREELYSKVQGLISQTTLLLEEFFVGRGVGVEILADHGSILCAFQHIRLHEPMAGGGSTYRRSMPLQRDLLDCTESFFSAIEWTGVAMAEFKCNFETGKFVLIEINGRFWGSLPLAVAAGVDFPFYLYQLLVHGRKTFNCDYKKSIFCRNLFMDVPWFLNNMTTKSTKYNNHVAVWKVLLEPFNLILFREHYDVLVCDDLAPAFRQLQLFMKKVRKRVKGLFLRQIFKLRIVKYICLGKLNKNMNKKLNICFVCKGNICRSPFAEMYLKKIVPEKGLCFNIISAGYYPKDSRLCPSAAIEAGCKFGVDLKQHRSRMLTDDIIEWADIIFVFDVDNYLTVLEDFKSCKSKVIMLGSLSKRTGIDVIEDPYSESADVFARTYTILSELLQHFIIAASKHCHTIEA